ncbi:ABC transporter ATP-binding protein [Oerskovia turbata]|uniref:ABC transporter ATP-binding protein n=2 Tax=Oerskovia turbata TaxID=1713 RepID=A0A4Q1KUN4_9CELL|nr:ABC transporter ATP-binding protein [Oerskovia turbata]RXR33455.1 ABC transporter ATP-binding protein [Oerskovia turbata]
MLTRRRWLFAGTVTVLLAGSVAGLATPALLGTLVNVVAEGGETSDLVRCALLLLGAGVLSAGLGYLGQTLLARICEGALADLREDVLASALDLPLEQVERAGVGDVVARVSGDVDAVSEAISGVLPAVTSAAFTIVLTLVGLGALDWRFALAALAAAPLQVVSLRWFLRRSGPVYREVRVAEAQRTEQVIETVAGATTVTTLGHGDRHEALVARSSLRAIDLSLTGIGLLTRFYNRLNVAELIGLGAVLAVGFWLVSDDAVTVGAATAAALYFHRLFGPIGTVLGEFDEIQKAGAGLARLVGVTATVTVTPGTAEGDGIPAEGGRTPAEGDRTPAEGDRVRAEGDRVRAEGDALSADGDGISADGDQTSTRGDHRGPAAISREARSAVVLRGVTFSYTPGRDVVTDVDLDVAEGEHVALVGASGAGKTSVAKLAMGIHRPTRGAVRVLGEAPGRRRRAVNDSTGRPSGAAMVSQEVHVFSGTLAEDLRLAAPDASDAELTAALDAVEAHWAHDLPDGLATVVGAGGLDLSPDRAQQLALARILLLDPAVVVLDEATAEVGTDGAATLDRAARAALAGRTAVVIAHRLSQARTADRVVVMESGRIVESGTHDALRQAGGRYAELWAAWERGTKGTTDRRG